MDPMRTAVRVAFTFVLVSILIHASGNRTLRSGDTPSFVIAVVLGDLFDDFFWAEIAASQFIVAVGTLVSIHLFARSGLTRSGMRTWRESSARRSGA